ncbi:cell wall-binding repeat-containing protein [Kineococcus sp. SYSU DK001]|uniref:cell wall-binding repeat-containing protein n=1 Tax=Kineococcus sp. SYSU DK001 TaxID=3383122 RepID=UPI003D7C720A
MSLRRPLARLRTLGLLATAAALPLSAATVVATTAPAAAAGVETVVGACPAGLPVTNAACGKTYTTAAASTGLQEIRGEDRYATAVAAARTGFPTADVVVLVSGEDAHLVDALSAAPLARRLAAPIVLTARGALPQATADYLAQRRPAAVLAIGGEPSVSTAVLDRVRALGVASVGRIAGGDRYSTSAAVAAFVTGGTHAWVASGDSGHLVDALAAAGPAARLGEPLVLAPVTGTADAAAQLRAAGTTSTTVVGGENAVGDAVAGQFPTARRTSGADRFATAKAVAEESVTRGVARGDVLVSNGEDDHLVDALAAAPLGRVTLLTGDAGAGTSTVTAWLAGGQDRTTFVGAAADDLVCWQVADCTRVASTDVDGDGARDDVALAGRAGDETQQLRVRADGTVRTVTVDTLASAHSSPWVGAAPLDDVAGDELVVLSEVGAHAERNTVLTWRNDALVAEAAPDPRWDRGSWFVDGSANLNTGITWVSPGHLIVRDTDVDDSGAHLIGTTQAYRSRNGVWAADGAATTVVFAADAQIPDEYSGWHVPGLPTYGS